LNVKNENKQENLIIREIIKFESFKNIDIKILNKFS